MNAILKDTKNDIMDVLNALEVACYVSEEKRTSIIKIAIGQLYDTVHSIDEEVNNGKTCD